MNLHADYLVPTYISDRHREAQQRMPSRGRDTSRQEARRARSELPYGALT